MQIPRQQFALKISSSECQGKSFTGFICLVSGKVSKRGQAASSRKLGWGGRSCLERVCCCFRGSSGLGDALSSQERPLWAPGRTRGPKEGLPQQKGTEDGPGSWRQEEDDMTTGCRLAEKQQRKRCLAMPESCSWKNRRTSTRDGPGFTFLWRKVRGPCLSLWPDTSPSHVVKSLLLSIFWGISG